MPSTSLQVDRYLIAAAVVLTCVLFTAQAADPVNVIKLTALLLVAIGLLCTTAYRAVRHRLVKVPLGVAGTVGALLGLALVVAALSAPVTTTAVLGTYGRNSGLLAYSAALLLFLVGLRVFGRPHARILVGGVILAGLFTALYGLMQKAGIDAIAWNNPFNPIIAALGNPNFASGYLGIAASAGAGGAMYGGWARGWRALSGATSALCLLTASLSSSVQGPIAAGGGLFIVATGVALNLTSRRRLPALAALGTAALTGVAMLLLGATLKTGPAAPLFGDVGSEARTHYWAAAVAMIRDAPLLGVGLDHYGASWWSHRSPDAVAALGGGQYSDAAHSVPLQMLAQGGLLLGTAYAAFVAVTAIFLVRALLRLTGDERSLLAAIGAGWAAYQVQSLVSIDQVPLIVLHFALAGAVIATAGASGLRELHLPGAALPVVAHRNDTRTRRRVAAAQGPKDRPLSGVDLALLSVVATVAATAAWQAFDPLRANAAVRDGDALRKQGDGTGAFQAYDHATDLVPGQAVYWIRKGQLFQGAVPPQTAQALQAFLKAADVDRLEINAIREAALLAETQNDLDLSRALHARALEVDPLGARTLVGAATFELRHAGAAKARQLLEAAVQAVPGEATVWATLGDARAVLGDPAAARTAYEAALRLDPTDATATQGLEKLAA